ncbi:MAG: hypothetical protein CL947_04200 [Epsilonproteobacteria bacterium]|nr:hypothetical protein [Campylobacterota bacterium]|tara:strand:- start:2529 stop:2852 length:324 start_codon:yes stop_codon:yes gene_type:complete
MRKVLSILFLMTFMPCVIHANVKEERKQLLKELDEIRYQKALIRAAFFSCSAFTVATGFKAVTLGRPTFPLAFWLAASMVSVLENWDLSGQCADRQAALIGLRPDNK